MRRYDDPVEVRRGVHAGGPEPEQFLWRGRLWKVRAVLATWVETGSWWHDQAGDALADGTVLTPVRDLLHEREHWRVRAGRGGLEGDGVFDLALDVSDGTWQLVGCHD